MSKKDFRRGMFTGILVTCMAVVFLSLYCPGIFLDGSHVLSGETVMKINFLEDMIDKYYLEEKSEEDLEEGLYAGLLMGLGDPYSGYYTKEENEQMTASSEGSYVGIGVAMQENADGGAKIVECYEGAPGEQAGLLPNDVICAVDEVDVTDKALSEIVSMIKGSEAEKVVLTISREGEEGTIEIEVLIRDVELPSVFPELLSDGKTGYIRISEFTGVTHEQYTKAFDELKEQGMEQMVVDLRNNPGGLLTSVCDVLEEILPEGLIVYTEDKYGYREEIYGEGKHPLDIPLAVLVNGSSASASEIFAGAVKDYGVGTIVGTTTFGKGVVQSIRELNDGSAVKLTVSKYYTPNGKNIHNEGIQPDIEVSLADELLGKSEISHEEDNQLQAALKALEG